MSTKQVKTGAVAAAIAAQNGNNNSQNGASSTSQPNLFISVDTFDSDGKTIGGRIVDMYHYGTRSWLQNHHWWAMHNGHTVECNVATDEQIAGYLASAKTQLAEKFGSPKVNGAGAATETVVEPVAEAAAA